MQDVISEMNKMNRAWSHLSYACTLNVEPAPQVTVCKRNLEAGFLPQTHPRIKSLRAEIIALDPLCGSPEVPPSRTGMRRVAFYGYMVNVRFSKPHIVPGYLWQLVTVAGSGKSILW